MSEGMDDQNNSSGENQGEQSTGTGENQGEQNNSSKELMVKKAYADRILREKKLAEDELKVLKAEKEAQEKEKLRAQGEHEKVAANALKERDEALAQREKEKEASRLRDFKRELKYQATKLGILDDDDVALIDTSQAEWDEEGEPQNAVDLVKAFKEAKPGKFKSTDTVVNEGTGKRATVTAKTNIAANGSTQKIDYMDRKAFPDADFTKSDIWRKSAVSKA